jgi:thiol:disulfide interchange protein DsbC
MLKGQEPVAKSGACEAPLKDIKTVALKSHVSGTPGLVFANGKLVPGVIKSFQIERYLAASVPPAPEKQSKN